MFTLYLHTPACLTIKLESRYDCVMPAVHNQRLSKLTKILKCQAFDVLHNDKTYCDKSTLFVTLFTY